MLKILGGLCDLQATVRPLLHIHWIWHFCSVFLKRGIQNTAMFEFPASDTLNWNARFNEEVGEALKSKTTGLSTKENKAEGCCFSFTIFQILQWDNNLSRLATIKRSSKLLQNSFTTQVMATYLITGEGPRPKLHDACLLVEWEIRHVDCTWTLQ